MGKKATLNTLDKMSYRQLEDKMGPVSKFLLIDLIHFSKKLDQNKLLDFHKNIKLVFRNYYYLLMEDQNQNGDKDVEHVEAEYVQVYSEVLEMKKKEMVLEDLEEKVTSLMRVLKDFQELS